MAVDVWEDAVSCTRGLRDVRNARCSESTGVVRSLIVNSGNEARQGGAVTFVGLIWTQVWET